MAQDIMVSASVGFDMFATDDETPEAIAARFLTGLREWLGTPSGVLAFGALSVDLTFPTGEVKSAMVEQISTEPLAIVAHYNLVLHV